MPGKTAKYRICATRVILILSGALLRQMKGRLDESQYVWSLPPALRIAFGISSSVWPAAAAVAQDLLGVAPGVLQRVGEYGHRAELARLVHLTSE